MKGEITMSYNYMKEMKANVKEAILDNYNLTEWDGRREEFEEQLKDDLWTDDGVTGNGSGSFTFDRLQAKEYVIDNGMGYLRDACDEFGIDAHEIGERFLSDDWEWMDVTIRCYLLGWAISDALDELEELGELTA